MSEADTARLLLAELEATEHVLRQLAVESLSYPGVLAVERRAFRRCEALLASVAFRQDAVARASTPAPRASLASSLEDLGAAPEATEELLTGGPMGHQIQSERVSAPDAGPLPSFASFASFEALDEGPEGVDDEGNDLRSDEAAHASGVLPEPEQLQQIDDLEPLDDEDTAETPEEVDLEAPVFSDPKGFEPDLEDATEPARGLDHDLDDDEDPTGRHDLRSVLAAETALADSHYAKSQSRASAPPRARALPSDLEEPDTDPEPSSDEAYISYVRYEDEPEPARDTALSGAGVESDDGPTLDGRPHAAPAHDPYAHLVSFEAAEEPPEDDLGVDTLDLGETQPEVTASWIPAPSSGPASARPADDRGRGARPAVLSDVGADALVTMEEHATVLMGDALSGRDEEELELEELELDDPDSFDLMPDLSDEVDVAADNEATLIRPAEPESRSRAPTASPFATPMAAPSSYPPKPAARVAAPVPTPRVSTPIGGGTGGLYGGGSVPTIRDSDDPRPRAAAIQLNSGGQGARVLGLEEEEEPIEIGAAEDDDSGEDDGGGGGGGGGGGFGLRVQEHEEEEYEEEEEADDAELEDDEVIEQKEPEAPAGPTAEENRALFDHAQATAANGDLQAGADLYSDLLDQDPDNVEAHVARGRLYLDLGDYSRAMSDFMVAEDLAPENPEPQVAIGDLYFARKDYRKAIDYFNIALEFSPNHAMAHCRRGISHYYRKNYPEAVSDLLRAQKLDADIPNIQTYVSMAKKKSK